MVPVPIIIIPLSVPIIYLINDLTNLIPSLANFFAFSSVFVSAKTRNSGALAEGRNRIQAALESQIFNPSISSTLIPLYLFLTFFKIKELNRGGQLTLTR